MDFKILFPTGHVVNDPFNDNVDVNIILQDRSVYFGSLFTIENVKSFLNRGDVYFWSVDMVIVRDLYPSTIRESISLMIENEYFQEAFAQIGVLGSEGAYKDVANYDSIIDMDAGYNY